MKAHSAVTKDFSIAIDVDFNGNKQKKYISERKTENLHKKLLLIKENFSFDWMFYVIHLIFHASKNRWFNFLYLCPIFFPKLYLCTSILE